MWKRLVPYQGPFFLGILLLAVNLVIGGCANGTSSTRSVSADDPYYYDSRYRSSVYRHHRAYRPAYRAPPYRGTRQYYRQ